VGVEKDYRDVGGGKALFGCCGRKVGKLDFYYGKTGNGYPNRKLIGFDT
jgi:hypothetical protein